jgi:hypothetical protein
LKAERGVDGRGSKADGENKKRPDCFDVSRIHAQSFSKMKRMMPLPTDDTVELVVARHTEDLRWLRRVPRTISITVYDKGAEPVLSDDLLAREGLRVSFLPNVGREAHSYLTHLVENYDTLASVTIFCQGHPFDHAPDFHERLRAIAMGEEKPSSFLWYGFLDETDDPCGKKLFVPWSKNPERRELSTGVLYELLFGEPSPDVFCFRGGAQFAVSGEAVRRRPREFYEKAKKLSLEIHDAAHSLERMWDRFFGKPLIQPSELGVEGVRYLKKIRRLEEGGSWKQPRALKD